MRKNETKAIENSYLRPTLPLFAAAESRFPPASLLTFQAVCVLKCIQGLSAPSARIGHNSSERYSLGIARNA
jgi:hypothetical protein